MGSIVSSLLPNPEEGPDSSPVVYWRPKNQAEVGTIEPHHDAPNVSLLQIINPYDFDICKLEARIFYYHALARALECGSGTRPGLPIEIVLVIMQLSECVVPSKSLSISTNINLLVESSEQTEVKNIWLATEPFTHESLTSIAALQAYTVSCNQGWVDNPNAGNYSWFEIAVGRLKTKSHHSILVHNPEQMRSSTNRLCHQ